MWGIIAVAAALAAFGLGVLVLRERRVRRRAAEAFARSETQLASLSGENARLEAQVGALAPYQSIVDVRAHCEAMTREATAAANQLRERADFEARAMRDGAAEEASRVLATAEADAAQTKVQATDVLLRAQARSVVTEREATAAANAVRERAESEARATKKQAEDKAAMLLATAEQQAVSVRTQASVLLRDAEARSVDSTRAALQAREEVRQLEGTARAIQNVIDGYGDRYLVPTAGVLDELAEEFGSREAGERLKATRERVRAMIKSRDASICDYVEKERKLTAEDFVLDAFNGKVEGILADVRHDNYGTLGQKIRDAFALVNLNGQAFRNARIREPYLDARLEELRWAVAVHELKVEEREEQRRIKEQIREEEKARREYEKARKDAEKEEDVLRKAMEKARREVEKAGEAQRAGYEAQLQELAEKLKAAEEKNQRALSMAQQTKAGHVYVISNVGSFGEEIFKVGMTRRLEPLDRIRELGDASVPFEFDVHAMIQCTDAPALEHALHKKFVRTQVNKVNARKEFFRVSLAELRAEIERLGVTASWTLTAECREWRETRAIEEALRTKQIDEKRWAAQQVAEHDRMLATATVMESVE